MFLTLCLPFHFHSFAQSLQAFQELYYLRTMSIRLVRYHISTIFSYFHLPSQIDEEELLELQKETEIKPTDDFLLAARFKVVLPEAMQRKTKHKKESETVDLVVKSKKKRPVQDEEEDEDENNADLDEELFNIEVTCLSKSVCFFVF